MLYYKKQKNERNGVTGFFGGIFLFVNYFGF